jgi:signal peptidase I
MRTTSWRWCRIAIAVTVIAVLAILFAPRQFGGRVTYLITAGSSMQPVLHQGDLVLVRSASHYGRGDAVAYRSDQLKTTVLHRIVGGNDGGFVMQGDNNDFLDPEKPADADILGRRWLRVSGGGKAVRLVLTPPGLGALAALAAIAMLVGGRAVAGPRPSRAVRSSAPASDGRWIAGFGVAAGTVFCAVAFAAPVHTESGQSLTYRHDGTFTYGADVAPSPVYPDGHVDPGEPVFLNVVGAVDVVYTYRFAGPAGTPAAVSGHGALVASLVTTDGIKREIELAPDAPVTGGALTLAGHLDAGGMVAMLQQVRAVTGTAGTDAVITVKPVLRIEGEVAGRAIADDVHPELAFTLDGRRLSLASASSTEAARHPVESHKVSVPATSATMSSVSVLGRQVPVGAARPVSAAGLAVSLAGFAFASVRRRGRVKVEGDEIARVVAVQRVDPGNRPVVDVPTMATLAVLAERADVVLRAGDPPAYYVSDGDLFYRYVVTPPQG